MAIRPYERLPVQTFAHLGCPHCHIARTMDRLMPQVQRCRVGDASGRLIVEITVLGETGKVISAKAVDETFANTAVGRCAAKAASDAAFSKFQHPRLTVRYPYEI